MTMLTEALEHLVRGIVDNPDAVRVDARRQRRGEMLEVRVDPADLGRVIGRQGRTASALRTVLDGLAGHPVRVDVVDTDRRR
ncbi:KH domain RNA binding protein YlqC [Micrococcus lylae]|uniref:RNA-binding protein KhpA n=3 Tax=Micrococcus lylae TaxID=1273 RepID=A0A1R4J458_9MICC|nr:KH domain RNA binding protein YlqC [Micrococcus lylae]